MNIKGIENYSNQWVALNEDKSEVIKSSSTYKGLLNSIKKIKDKVFLLKVPPFEGSLSP